MRTHWDKIMKRTNIDELRYIFGFFRSRLLLLPRLPIMGIRTWTQRSGVWTLGGRRHAFGRH